MTRAGVRRVAVGVIAVLGSAVVSLVVAASAHACSCAGAPIRAELESAPVVLVGDVLSTANGMLTIRPTTVIKGSIHGDVRLRFNVGCVTSEPPSGEIGLLVFGEHNRWSSSDCSLRAPADLHDAAAPLPRPESLEPIAMLVHGDIGEARLAGLDAHGRIVAYGLGEGHSQALAVCPGGRHALELAGDSPLVRSGGPYRPPAFRVVEWDLSTMTAVDRSKAQPVRSIACASMDGRDRWLAVGAADDLASSTTRLEHRSTAGMTSIDVPAAAEVVWHLPTSSAYLVSAPVGVAPTRDLMRVDLRTGTVTPIAVIGAGHDGPFPNPDGSRLALLDHGPFETSAPPSELRVLSPDGLEAVVLDGKTQRFGRVTWLPNGHLLVGSIGQGDHFYPAREYDENLEVVDTIAALGASVLVGDQLVSVDAARVLRLASIGDWQTTDVRTFVRPSVLGMSTPVEVSPPVAFTGEAAAPAPTFSPIRSAPTADESSSTPGWIIAALSAGVAVGAALLRRRQRMSEAQLSQPPSK